MIWACVSRTKPVLDVVDVYLPPVWIGDIRYGARLTREALGDDEFTFFSRCLWTSGEEIVPR